jgi:hypothetical protein
MSNQDAEKEVRLCLLCEHVFTGPKEQLVVDCPKCLSRLPGKDDEEHADELQALALRVPELRRKREKSLNKAMVAASRRRHGLPPLPQSAAGNLAVAGGAQPPRSLRLPLLGSSASSRGFSSTIG